MASSKSVYFYCLKLGAGSRPAYQYQSIVLAQGLKKLGFSIYSNVDYWVIDGEAPKFLFVHDENVSAADCAIVFVPCQWLAYGQELPIRELKSAVNSIKVLIDVCDGLFTLAFKSDAKIFDVILKQKTSGLKYPDNCKHPWAFGLSHELLAVTSESPAFSCRNKAIAVNFRHRHSIREMFKNRVAGQLGEHYSIDTTYESLGFSYKALNSDALEAGGDLLFQQSGGRHGESYINRLKKSMCCAAFGGYFMLGKNRENHKLWHTFASYAVKGRAGGSVSGILDKLPLQINHTYNVYQWDSWRYWESVACGCVTFHLDFELYGIQLPVMPTNWAHYIGFDLLRPKECIERFLTLSISDLETIGVNGRKWAVAHYTPEPMAKMFLCHIGWEL